MQVVATVDVDELDRTELKQFADSGTARSRGIIAPNSGINIVRSGTRLLKDEEFQDVLKRRWGIFIFGTITYQDIFKKTRTTDFRLASEIRGLDPKTGYVPIIPTEGGNDAT